MASSLAVSTLFNVKGKVALVTGGGRGIGLMIARTLAANGARVYIASRDKKVLEKAAADISAEFKTEVRYLVADLGNKSACTALAQELAQKEKALHILVNNSGANWGAPIENYSDASWDKVMNLNVKGVFYLTVALLPLLKAAATTEDPSRVINVGSVNGIDPPLLETYAYSSSKAALHMLTKHLATRLAREKVTVNALACGPFESKMMKATLDQFGDAIRESLPLKRIGSEEDVGGAVLFLSSRAGSFLTGAIVPVEGGALIKASL